jgi:outer membrane autotransporter protein
MLIIDYIIQRDQTQIEDTIKSLGTPYNRILKVFKDLFGDTNKTGYLSATQVEQKVIGSGAIYSTVAASLLAADKSIMRAISHRGSQVAHKLEYARSDVLAVSAGVADLRPSNNLWVNIGGSHTSLDGAGKVSKAVLSGPEVTIGYESVFEEGWFAGIAFLYGAKRLKMNSLDAKADIDSVGGAIYGGKATPWGPGFLRLLLAMELGRHDISAERRVDVAGVSEKLKADYSGKSLISFVEAAYRTPISKMVELEPYVTVGWHSLKTKDFKEKGGLFGMRGRGESHDRFLTALGLRSTLAINDNISFNLEAGWRHVYGRAIPPRNIALNQTGTVFLVERSPLSRDEALIGVGATFNFSDSMSVDLNYQGSMGGKEKSHGGALKLTFMW